MKMFKLCLIVFIINLIFGSYGEAKNRQAKFFSFNVDSEDVEVGLDFSIPFIKIPVKKAFNAVAEFGIPGLSLSKININPMAIVIGGMVIIFTSIIAPLVNEAFAWHNLDRSSRFSDNNDLNNITSSITEQLLANSRSCPERFACWAGRRNKNTRSMENWKLIMSNELLSTIVNTTALKAATLKGVSGQNCEHYTPCPIEERTLPKLFNNIATLTNSKYFSNFNN